MNIEVARLSYRFRNQPALEDIDLKCGPGEILALVGPNGAGKTTLLRNISGVLRPHRGAVYLDGQDLSKLKRRQIALNVAAVEQEIEIGFDFTVREIVDLGRIPHRKFLRSAGRHREVVERAMHAMEISALAEKSMWALSSGERQRVWLAMALAQEPSVLLLDEPTAHLDIGFQIEILERIRSLARENLTVLMSIHDLNLAANYAGRIAVMKNGRLKAVGPPKSVLTEGLIAEVFQVRAKVIETPGNGFLINLWP